jgi:hypothetical protein
MRIAVISVLIFLSACDYYDNRLRIVNHTKSKITVGTYNDTIPDFPSAGKTEFYLRRLAEPGDTLEVTEIGKNGWPFVIARSWNKKLNLIVYSVDSLLKYQSIDTLIKKEIYERYEFSEEELKTKNWVVVLQ